MCSPLHCLPTAKRARPVSAAAAVGPRPPVRPSPAHSGPDQHLGGAGAGGALRHRCRSPLHAVTPSSSPASTERGAGWRHGPGGRRVSPHPRERVDLSLDISHYCHAAVGRRGDCVVVRPPSRLCSARLNGQSDHGPGRHWYQHRRQPSRTVKSTLHTTLTCTCKLAYASLYWCLLFSLPSTLTCIIMYV